MPITKTDITAPQTPIEPFVVGTEGVILVSYHLVVRMGLHRTGGGVSLRAALNCDCCGICLRTSIIHK